MPERCPECGSPYIAAFGLGTQKVEEMLQRQFPMAKVLRMDADTTSGKHGHESVLSRFREGRADILIGTQMIVKGHDFPNVTLVAALAADMSMFENDYRSSERTFQLLMQASGRAGRGQKQGEVIIQTYRPDHYVIQSVAAQDAEVFYENELAYRRVLSYPPYFSMLTIRIFSEDREKGLACVRELSGAVRGKFGCLASVVGPADDGGKKRKDQFGYTFYVKTEELAQIEAVKTWVDLEFERKKYACYIQYEVD